MVTFVNLVMEGIMSAPRPPKAKKQRDRRYRPHSSKARVRKNRASRRIFNQKLAELLDEALVPETEVDFDDIL